MVGPGISRQLLGQILKTFAPSLLCSRAENRQNTAAFMLMLNMLLKTMLGSLKFKECFGSKIMAVS